MDRYLAFLNRGVLSKGLTAADAEALRAQAQAKIEKARKQMGLKRDEIEAQAKAQLLSNVSTVPDVAISNDLAVLETAGKASVKKSLKSGTASNGGMFPGLQSPASPTGSVTSGVASKSGAPAGPMSPLSPRTGDAAADPALAASAASEVHMEEYLCFRVCATGLPRGDMFGSTDSYLELSCQRDGNWVPIIASDIVNGTTNPLYAPLACKAKELFSNLDASLPIRVSVWQWHKNKASVLLGEAITTLPNLKRAGGPMNSNNTPKYGVQDMKKKDKVAQGVGTVPDNIDWLGGPMPGPVDVNTLMNDGKTLVLPLGKPGKKKKEGYVIFERCDVMHDKVARRTLQAVSMSRVSENTMTEKDIQLAMQQLQNEMLPADLLSLRSGASRASKRSTGKRQ